MIKKGYKKVKEFVIEEYKFLIFLVVMIIVITYPLPYYVTVGGGVSNISKRVEIENGYKSSGSFNFTYVEELKGTTLSYIYGKLFNKEIISSSSITLDNEDIDDYQIREKIQMQESIDNAIYSAYNLANKDVNVISNSLKILYILPQADTTLKVGDEILKVNDIIVGTIDEYKQEVAKYSLEDSVNVVVKRNNKKVNCTAKLIEYEGSKVLGLYVYIDKEYETDPKVTFNMSKRESGPSGGLMLALSIYNGLVEDDITKGRKIAGTGTIDINGEVGEVGGVNYKLEGAVKSKADVFIAPSGENYQEVVELVKKNNYNIKVIEAKTLSQVINDLS